MQANVPARTIYYQLYGIEDKGIASFSTVTSSQDGSDSFSQSEILDGRGVSLDQRNTVTVSTESSFSTVTSSQENLSAIEANSKSVKDTGSEVKVYDFSKLLEN